MGAWSQMEEQIHRECMSCRFLVECPPVSDKDECVAIIHNLEAQAQPLSSLQVRKTLSYESVGSELKLEYPRYDTVDTSMPWRAGRQPLLRCPQAGEKARTQMHEADSNLEQAVSIFCEAGLGSMVEFYVDTGFRSNYAKLQGPDGWIEKAYLTYLDLHETRDNVSAETDLLLQSIHRFSKYPVVLTNFGMYVPKYLTAERFPNVVLMHSRSSTASIQKDFNFNKLNSMLFTKVKGGVVLDADQWVNHGSDVMIERAFEETTRDYPYPILPVHFMSRDPGCSDMKHFPSQWAFTFKSKEGPRRSMRWGHAHPTWTHYALPWLARWTSYVLAPDQTHGPTWLKDQGFLSDEDLLNCASWAEGLTKQWCKFDIPGSLLYYAYIDQVENFYDTYKGWKRLHGIDSKYFPKGVPYVFLTSHNAKDPAESYDLLSQLWESGNVRQNIHYDGRWFASASDLKHYDPSLRCLV